MHICTHTHTHTTHHTPHTHTHTREMETEEVMPRLYQSNTHTQEMESGEEMQQLYQSEPTHTYACMHALRHTYTHTHLLLVSPLTPHCAISDTSKCC